MSRLNLSPNYCSCTVLRARNLHDKGKGINAFCVISLGDEKYVTGVCQSTTSPEWMTQCDLPITDANTPIKLTIYNNTKNSLSKGDFIGRALISLRDLPDYDRVHNSWYKLTKKDGKSDKDRGEIEVSLQFYSKNAVTGSVLDLTTKKKHVSLTDIKQSLREKLPFASKQRKADKHDGENQLANQRRRLSGGSHLGQDFLDESVSESTSFTGSQMSLNSMSYNNNAEQHKKKSRAPTNGTPRSQRRSITSDYESSSILDSASMYGGDEPSTSSPSVQSQNPPFAPQREVNVDEHISLKSKKKSKDPAPVLTITKPPDSHSPTKGSEISPKQDSIFGLSTIKEGYDNEENLTGSRPYTDDEIDFDGCFNKIQQTKTKKSAPILPQSKEPRHSTNSQSEDIRTPSTSISINTNYQRTSSTLTKHSDDFQDSTDDDVEELLGNLERMSSMRSSARRRVQPRDDIMQQSLTETEIKTNSGPNLKPPPVRNGTNALPDIIGGPRGQNSSQYSNKPGTKGLCVLGYDNVKATPIHPKLRQELEYIDREDLLHIIAHQSDIIKKRDARIRDLEQYTDSLLVKIVEQCPSILQVGNSPKRLIK